MRQCRVSCSCPSLYMVPTYAVTTGIEKSLPQRWKRVVETLEANITKRVNALQGSMPEKNRQDNTPYCRATRCSKSSSTTRSSIVRIKGVQVYLVNQCLGNVTWPMYWVPHPLLYYKNFSTTITRATNSSINSDIRALNSTAGCVQTLVCWPSDPVPTQSK